MKLNISDYVSENEVLVANEQGLIRDDPKPKIEETWDKLAEYYTSKAIQENTSELAESEFYAALAHARVDNENALAVNELCNKGILREYENTEFKEERANIKVFIAKELLKIVRNRYIELKNSITDENNLFQALKTLKYESRIINNQLRIHITPTRFVEYEKVIGADAETIGLSCKITFKDIIISGFYQVEALNSFEERRIRILEDDLVGKYNFGNVILEISKDNVRSTNDLANAVISELISGSRPRDVILKLPVYFSRYFLAKLICNSSKRKLVQTSTETLCDGLSSAFYVMTDDSIFKIVRSEKDVEMYINGCMIDLKTVCTANQ